jgi:hypothetical protein
VLLGRFWTPAELLDITLQAAEAIDRMQARFLATRGEKEGT